MSELLVSAQFQYGLQGIGAGIGIYLLLLALHCWPKLSRGSRLLLVLPAANIAGLGLGASLVFTWANIRWIRGWDFLCFWIYGSVVANGQNPYDASLLRELSAPFSPGSQFQELFYCPYPPPCVVLYMPLGYLPISVAAALWCVLQWTALVSVIVLLRRFFAPDQEVWTGLIFSAAMTFSLQSTASTFHFAQTNFLLVASVLCATLVSTGKGLWLGLATVVKPIAAILAMEFVVKRAWKSLTAMIAVLMFTTAMFVSQQGWSGLVRYRDNNPLTGEISDIYYTEDGNQSLLSTLLRVTGTAPGRHPILFPVFIIAAAILTAITLLVVYRLPQDRRHMGLGCLLSLALLVYPNTLAHYSVCLLIPVAFLWSERNRVACGPQALLIAIALSYGLVWGKLAFYANFVIWATLMATLTFSRSAGDHGGQ